MKQFACTYKNNVFSGSSNGTLTAKSKGTYSYPEKFGKGEANQNTLAGFGLLWEYNFALGGGYNVTLLSDSYTGSVYGTIDGDMDVYMKWDGFLWWDGSEIIQKAKITGKLDIAAAGIDVVASGKVKVTYEEGTKEINFSCNILG